MNRWTVEPRMSPPDGTFYVISPQLEPLCTKTDDGECLLLVFDSMSGACRVCDLLNMVGPTCAL